MRKIWKNIVNSFPQKLKCKRKKSSENSSVTKVSPEKQQPKAVDASEEKAVYLNVNKGYREDNEVHPFQVPQ